MGRGFFFDDKDVIGHGCFGTVVYRGTCRGNKVAVKRVMAHAINLCKTEAELLAKFEHPNVLKLIDIDKTKEFWYLALELCSASLAEYCEGKYIGVMPEEIQALKQMAEGLNYIHSKKYVHRDIKPSNILILQKEDRAILKIADFGFCKVVTGIESFTVSSDKGSMGWMAPETYKEPDRLTMSIDVFALGCVFYYYITKGKHPFGRELERTNNILQNKPHLSDLNKKHILRGVIKEMIQENPEKRPKLSELVTRPVFHPSTPKADRESGSFSSFLKRLSSAKEDKRNSKEVESPNAQQNPDLVRQLETSPKSEPLLEKPGMKKTNTWTTSTLHREKQKFGSLPRTSDASRNKPLVHGVSQASSKLLPIPSNRLNQSQSNGPTNDTSKQPERIRKISANYALKSSFEKTISYSSDSQLNKLQTPNSPLTNYPRIRK